MNEDTKTFIRLWAIILAVVMAYSGVAALGAKWMYGDAKCAFVRCVVVADDVD